MTHSRPVVLLVLLAVASALGLTPASAAPRPGVAGAGIVLDRDASYLGMDVDTDADGTTYVGWISTHNSDDLFNQVHLCVLPTGASACRGGVQTIDAIEKVSAEKLFVVASGSGATLVWHHMADDSASGGASDDRIATARVVDGVLQPGGDVALAPSDSTLLAVSAGPRGIGAVVVSGPDDESTTLTVWDTLAAPPATVTAPYSVGAADLADDGTSTVLMATEYAEPYQPVQVAWKPSGSGTWSGFTPVRGTESDHDSARMIATSGGIRLVATGKDTEDGHPRTVVAAWKGGSHRFAKPVTGLTQSCPSGSRDLAADASGRLTSVSIGCDVLALGNHQTGGAGALAEIDAGLTVESAGARVASVPSGRGWVAWVDSRGYDLMIRPIRLPALTSTRSARSAAGRVRLEGPVSCLPAVVTRPRVTATPVRSWRVVGSPASSLRLGSKKVGKKIDGSALKPGRRYVLTASVRFARAGATRDVSVRSSFRTCARP